MNKYCTKIMLVAMLSQASASRPRNAVPPVRRRVADYINREVRQ